MIFEGNEIKKRMDVVGEEGTSLDDFISVLKAEFLDAVYLQQNAFDKVDAYTTIERQAHAFDKVFQILTKNIKATDKDDARSIFFRLTSLFKNWNSSVWQSDGFKALEREIDEFIAC
jgi:V/A-type H+-transporting ATPase subunit A